METTLTWATELSRLMLGTAQFGLPYGIANRTGQPSYEEARDIIACAYEGGVNCLDTAAAYGTSEAVIGRALAELGLARRMTVVTKLPAVDAAQMTAAQVKSWAHGSVSRSLERLGLETLPVLLFHREENFALAEAALELKAQGWVAHVGSSVMTPAATGEIIATGQCEALQIPTNALDRRFTRAGNLAEAERRGIAVFVRSVFLQGLLLMPDAEIPGELAEVLPVLGRVRKIALEAGLPMAELCARYVLSLPGVTCAVVGVETVEQTRANLGLFSRGPLPVDVMSAVEGAVPDLDDEVLMPNRWPNAMR